jgi:hypothetical protein
MSESTAAYGLVAAFVIGLVLTAPKKPENYTHPGKLPLVGFWNLFDSSRFTEEGIAYHRRLLRWTALWAGVAIAGGILV